MQSTLFISKNFSKSLIPAVLAALLGVSANVLAADVDVGAAESLAKSSKCFKCHAVDKKKDGPSFKVTADKYKGKADAEQKLIKHITTGPKIKVDGVEEEHTIVKSKNDAEILNLVRFILSR